MNPSNFDIKATMVYQRAFSPMQRREYEHAERLERTAHKLGDTALTTASSFRTTGARSRPSSASSTRRSGLKRRPTSASTSRSSMRRAPSTPGSMRGSVDVSRGGTTPARGAGSRSSHGVASRTAGESVAALADGPLGRALELKAAESGSAPDDSHEPLRVYRHGLPAAFSEIYVRFVTMLNVVNSDLADELLSDVRADARAHRNHMCLNIAAALSAARDNPNPVDDGSLPFPSPDIVDNARASLPAETLAPELRAAAGADPAASEGNDHMEGGPRAPVTGESPKRPTSARPVRPTIAQSETTGRDSEDGERREAAAAGS